MSISIEDANKLASVLNHVCTATIQALTEGDIAQRLSVAASLRTFRAQLDTDSEVGTFCEILIEWLEGERPSKTSAQRLSKPFQRALRTMLQQVPDKQSPTSPPAAATPISRQVLTQLIAAVVATAMAGDEKAKQKLGTHLLNIRMELDTSWQERLGPLLENLRYVLGGVDPRTLPAIPDPYYQRLWQSAAELLTSTGLTEEVAHEQLLDRLVHNTLFVIRANNPELTENYLRSLLEVQRQALESGPTEVATVIGAIRAHLQELDTSAFTGLMTGAERDAWQRIVSEKRRRGA